MQQINSHPVEELPLTLPAGLFGFEELKQWTLTGVPEEAPFLRLRAAEAPEVSFVALPPALAVADYQPDLLPSDVAALQLQNPAEAFVVNLVTLPASGQPTVNLKGPIVINRRARLGKQVVPANAAAYDVHHPLPVAS